MEPGPSVYGGAQRPGKGRVDGQPSGPIELPEHRAPPSSSEGGSVSIGEAPVPEEAGEVDRAEFSKILSDLADAQTAKLQLGNDVATLEQSLSQHGERIALLETQLKQERDAYARARDQHEADRLRWQRDYDYWKKWAGNRTAVEAEVLDLRRALTEARNKLGAREEELRVAMQDLQMARSGTGTPMTPASAVQTPSYRGAATLPGSQRGTPPPAASPLPVSGTPASQASATASQAEGAAGAGRTVVVPSEKLTVDDVQALLDDVSVGTVDLGGRELVGRFGQSLRLRRAGCALTNGVVSSLGEAQPDNTTVPGPPDANGKPQEAVCAPGVVVEAPGCKLENVVVKGAGRKAKSYPGQSGIMVKVAREVVLRRCEASGMCGIGLVVHCAERSELDTPRGPPQPAADVAVNCTLVDCTVQRCQWGIFANRATIAVRRTAVQETAIGVMCHTRATMLLAGCFVRGNRVALYASRGGVLECRTSDVQSNHTACSAKDKGTVLCYACNFDGTETLTKEAGGNVKIEERMPMPSPQTMRGMPAALAALHQEPQTPMGSMRMS
ncbi:unnamed protein product [Pedinophyceae sp. YPF-701]|nr:unnamed protein product [Pedinophyceae sp. YPF-701]